MLIVAALKLGDPVLLIILVKTYDFLFHRGRAYRWVGLLLTSWCLARCCLGALREPAGPADGAGPWTAILVTPTAGSPATTIGLIHSASYAA